MKSTDRQISTQPVPTDNCPKCGFKSRVPFHECPRCGVIIAKYWAKQAQKEEQESRKESHQEKTR